jgi:hypothetical protein
LLTDNQRYESGDCAHRNIKNGLSSPLILMTTPFKNKKVAAIRKKERKEKKERKKDRKKERRKDRKKEEIRK